MEALSGLSCGNFMYQTKSKYLGGEYVWTYYQLGVNLARQRIVEDDRCEVCSLAKETRFHALWECGLAQDIWAGCSRRLQKGVTTHEDMLQLVDLLQHRLDDDELELFWV